MKKAIQIMAVFNMMLFSAFGIGKKYKNPILLCDYSDPDVIRVEDTFYLTASSFNFMPGLPILASTDLINWTLVNYAAKNIPLSGYEKPQHSKGLWAPSIRYHDGRFYIFVATPDEGIFFTETKNPADEWSPLKPVWIGKGFIDPCPFWDNDGKVYVVHAYAKSRIGFKSKLGILEVDPTTFEAKSEDKFIFDGTETQPTIEGPKVYKRGDMYYIFAPAGGVKKGWQTVLRSKNIYGPYEEKIVLAQGKTLINGPHQGGLVQTQTGEEWFVHFQDRGIYGRITHLEPVAWKDGWPCMGTAAKTKKIPGEPVFEYDMPKCATKKNNNPIKINNNNFEKGKICAIKNADLNWQWTANYSDDFATADENGIINLNVLNTTDNKKSIPILYESANILTQKFSLQDFSFNVKADFSDLPEEARSGIIFLAGQYASIAVEHEKDEWSVCYIESEEDRTNEEKRIEKIKDKLILPSDCDLKNIEFELIFKHDSDRSGSASFSVNYNQNGSLQTWKPNVSSYKPGNAQWVGGRFGIYTVGNNSGKVKYSTDVQEIN